MSFVNIVIHEFITAQKNEVSESIIPPWPFEVMKKVVLLEIRYCCENESSSKHVIKKSDKFTNDTIDVQIKKLPN